MKPKSLAQAQWGGCLRAWTTTQLPLFASVEGVGMEQNKGLI